MNIREELLQEARLEFARHYGYMGLNLQAGTLLRVLENLSDKEIADIAKEKFYGSEWQALAYLLVIELMNSSYYANKE